MWRNHWQWGPCSLFNQQEISPTSPIFSFSDVKQAEPGNITKNKSSKADFGYEIKDSRKVVSLIQRTPADKEK